MNIILFAICFAIPFLTGRVKYPWTLLITAGVMMVPLLGVLDSLFAYINSGNWKVQSENALSYVGQFSYVYANVLNLSEILELSGLKFGTDFITGLLSILPGVDFTPAYEFTSQLYFGKRWMSVAGTPIDIITLGYIQFGIFGIPMVAALLGTICGKMDRLITQMDSKKYGVFITALITGIYGYTINADISTFIKSQFQLSICLLCILYAFSDKYKKHKRLVFRMRKK